MFALSAEELDAVRLSLKVAAWATLAALPFGVGVAWMLARLRGRWLLALDALVHLPLVIPPVVTGYLLLIVFGRRAPVGQFLESTLGIVFSFRWTGAALACAVMGFPLMVRAIRLAIEAVDRRLEQAAATLGASPVRVFATVTLPLALPGVVAGALLCFARALGEFGATITFVSSIPGETQTIPAAIYAYTQAPGGDAGAMRLTLVSIAISVAALATSAWLSRRAALHSTEAR
jgi:molybdate transport system permease protein